MISLSVLRNQPKSSEKANVLVLDWKWKHGNDGPSDKASHFGIGSRYMLFPMLKIKGLTIISRWKSMLWKACPLNSMALLCVQWKMGNGEVVTSPIKLIIWVTKFEEKFSHTGSVQCSRNGPHHPVNYEAKAVLAVCCGS